MALEGGIAGVLTRACLSSQVTSEGRVHWPAALPPSPAPHCCPLPPRSTKGEATPGYPGRSALLLAESYWEKASAGPEVLPPLHRITVIYVSRRRPRCLALAPRGRILAETFLSTWQPRAAYGGASGAAKERQRACFDYSSRQARNNPSPRSLLLEMRSC